MLALVLVLLLILLALLAVPVELKFRLERDTDWRGECEIAWFFNLMHGSLASNEATEKKVIKRKKTRKSSSQGISSGHVIAAIRDRRIRQHLSSAWRRLMKAFRLSELMLRVRVGFDDPADTGYLCGVAAPVTAALARRGIKGLVIEPDFGGEALRVDGRGKMRIIPLELLWLSLCFAVSPTTLRMIRVLNGKGR